MRLFSLSPCRFFSGFRNSATGLPLHLRSRPFVVFSSAAPASFSMSWRGGGGTQMFVHFHLLGSMLSVVLIRGVYFAYSAFRLPSSVPPVSCACFPALVVLVVVFGCHSACRLALSLSSPSRSVVSTLYSPLPFIRCSCSHLHQFRVSGFPSCLLCAASAFAKGCFPCFLQKR